MSREDYFKRDEVEFLCKQFPTLSREIIDTVGQQYRFNIQKTAYYLYEMMKDSPTVNKPEFNREESRIIDLIKSGWKVIVLMRGLPGSGKTYLANKIFDSSNINYPRNQFILSTDDFFKRNGTYNYDVKRLEDAHDWNQKRCYKMMTRGFSPIIIDNTNLVSWEMKVYCMMASEYGYIIEVLEPNTNWACDPSILEKKNMHKVPKDKLIRMLNKFDRSITSMSLMREFCLKQVAPQKRLFPPLFSSFDENVNPTGGRGIKISNLVSSNQLDEFNFSFEKKINELPIMEYVHCFDSKKEEGKRESPKEDVKMSDNATSLYPPLSLEVDQNKSSSSDFKNTQSVLKTNHDEIKQVESKTIQNEPKKDSPREPKVSKTTSTANLIDLLDLSDNNPSSAPTTSVNLYGAFPLMPTSVQSSQSNQTNPSNQSSESVQSIDKIIDLKSSTSTSNEKNHLTAWGTNEKALQSWETVVTVPSTKLPIEMDFEIYKKLGEASRPRTQVSDKKTNTHSDDFRFAQNCPEADGISVLNTKNRAINGSGITITKSVPRKKITVDMGCMTEEPENPENNNNQVVQQLLEFFPNIPVKYMLEIYEKCNRDLNWTIELLLETPYDPKLEVEIKEKKKVSVDDDNSKGNSPMETPPPVMSSSQEVTSKKDVEDQLRREKIELKKKFEENVTFKKEHYSDFLWGLKNQRQGTSETSKISPQSSIEETQDVDYDFDEEDEDTVQINLGNELVGQLETYLGSEDFVNKNLPTTVQMPISLVKQLHALYLQSICQQIEEQNELINKDEQYAHKLNNEEREAVEGPNLSMIMDEQLAKFYQKKENEQYKTMAPQTLAMIMKKKKLYESFPSVNQNMIDHLLQSHNYNYDEVVDILISNVNQTFIVSAGNIREDPIPNDIVKDMEENKAIADKIKNDEDYHNAQQFRDDALSYAQKAQHLQTVAQDYHRRGMGQVAVFYSKLAEDLRKKRDLCDQKATFMHLYENSLGGRSDTLDLHYLKVTEALISLDIYIDKCVAKLDKPKDFYIITGKGNRSVGGKSKLKPAVIARLRKRKIGFNMMNPGLLRIKLHKNVTRTTDLKK